MRTALWILVVFVGEQIVKVKGKGRKRERDPRRHNERERETEREREKERKPRLGAELAVPDIALRLAIPCLVLCTSALVLPPLEGAVLNI